MDGRRVVSLVVAALLGAALVAGLWFWMDSRGDDPVEEPVATEPAEPEPPSESPDPADRVHVSEKGVSITVDTPIAGQVVTSPLSIRGLAPGSWSFEANFELELRDADGTVLGKHYATMLGDWMTEDDVAFESTLEFDPPRGDAGVLILRRANASGLPEHTDAVEIPVSFR